MSLGGWCTVGNVGAFSRCSFQAGDVQNQCKYTCEAAGRVPRHSACRRCTSSLLGAVRHAIRHGRLPPQGSVMEVNSGASRKWTQLPLSPPPQQTTQTARSSSFQPSTRYFLMAFFSRTSGTFGLPLFVPWWLATKKKNDLPRRLELCHALLLLPVRTGLASCLTQEKNSITRSGRIQTARRNERKPHWKGMNFHFTPCHRGATQAIRRLSNVFHFQTPPHI